MGRSFKANGMLIANLIASPIRKGKAPIVKAAVKVIEFSFIMYKTPHRRIIMNPDKEAIISRTRIIGWTFFSVIFGIPQIRPVIKPARKYPII